MIGLRIAIVYAVSIGVAQAAECNQPTLSGLTFEGSLPVQYASNPGRTYGSRNPDGTLSPYLKLSGSGSLTPDVNYSIYASGGIDRCLKSSDGNASFAALGTQLVKDWGTTRLSFTYERALYFEEYFRRSEAIANDFGASLRTSFVSQRLGVTVRPMLSATARFDDHGSLQRTLLSARLGLEKTLTREWALLLSSQARMYDYDGSRSGRIDTIYSLSGGVRYDVSRNVSWTTSMIYEARNSNAPRSDFVNYIVSTSIDFSFDLLGSR